MTAPMIEHDVLQATLDHALSGGGDFAEVFVEDRRSSSARFDEGRIEELVSGRDRGAGLRVVRGDTTGFAHTADLSPEGLRLAAEAAAGAARGGGGGTHAVALGPAESHPIDPDVVVPESVEKRRKVELLARADAAAARNRHCDHFGHRGVRRRAAPHPRRELRRPGRRRRPGAHADVGPVCRDRRHRDADRL